MAGGSLIVTERGEGPNLPDCRRGRITTPERSEAAAPDSGRKAGVSCPQQGVWGWGQCAGRGGANM